MQKYNSLRERACWTKNNDLMGKINWNRSMDYIMRWTSKPTTSNKPPTQRANTKQTREQPPNNMQKCKPERSAKTHGHPMGVSKN